MGNSPSSEKRTAERRVVITGIGLVSPLGIGAQKNWDNLIQGKSGVSQISRFDVSEYTSKIAGQVPDFNPLDFLDKKETRNP